jgi:hypothetical protein
MDAPMQIREVGFQVLLVALPRPPIHAGGRFPLKPGKGIRQQVDRDVVQQGGEPFLLVLLCCFSYTFKPRGHAFPAQSPARARLARVSLGPLPWLEPTPPLVAQVCSSASLLLRRGLTSPTRASSASTPRLPDADRSPTADTAKPEISRFPVKERTYMPGSRDLAGPSKHSQYRACPCGLPLP